MSASSFRLAMGAAAIGAERANRIARTQSYFLEQCHRVTSQSFASPDVPQSFVGRGFDVDARSGDTQIFGDVGEHRFAMRSQARRIGENRRVDVDDGIVPVAQQLHDVTQQLAAIRAPPLSVGPGGPFGSPWPLWHGDYSPLLSGGGSGIAGAHAEPR